MLSALLGPLAGAAVWLSLFVLSGNVGDVASPVASNAALGSIGANQGAPDAALPAPPATRPPRAASGPEALFARNCAPCHGERSERVATARLGSRQFVERLGEAGLTKSISEGKGLMPAWLNSRAGALTVQEIRGLVDYLVSTAVVMPDPTPVPVAPKATRPETAPSGSGLSEQGRDLFKNNCESCHAQANTVASLATPAKVKQMAVALTEAQSASVFEYLKSLALGGADSPGKPAGVEGTAAPTAAPIASNRPPPAAPHRTVAVQNACLDCHGSSGISPVPVGHKGRRATTCLLCHQEGKVPSPVTHPIEGREGKCDGCHKPGGIIPSPADHQNRKSTNCVLCHAEVAPSTQAGEREQAPSIPHFIPDRNEVCFECHRSGGLASPLPKSHSSIGAAVCLMCHATPAARRAN